MKRLAKKMRSSIVLLLSVLLFLGGATPSKTAAARQVTTEVRAIWLHPESIFSADPTKGEQQVQDFVGHLADANFNLIFVWVRSEYVAALTDTRYQKAVPIAKWDALGELIKAAQSKGIQVQAWYSFTYYKTAASADFDPKLRGDPQWAARRVSELVPNKATGKTKEWKKTTICPTHPEARQWEINLINQVLNRYPGLTGIHIEEPGYGFRDYCVCDLCLQKFKDQYGTDLAADITGPEALDFKCTQVTTFMRELRDSLKKRTPPVTLSCNGSYNWKLERMDGRDWGKWSQQGLLDFYVSQVYTPDPSLFEQRVKKARADLSSNCPLIVGIGLKWTGGENNVDAVMKEIDQARSLGAQGITLYSASHMTDSYWNALKSGPFKESVTLPAFAGKS